MNNDNSDDDININSNLNNNDPLRGIHRSIIMYADLIKSNNESMMRMFRDYFHRVSTSENSLYRLLDRQLDLYDEINRMTLQNLNTPEQIKMNHQIMCLKIQFKKIQLKTIILK